MLTPKQLLGFEKEFELDEVVLVMFKGYPLFCRVLEMQEESGVKVCRLQIEDDAVAETMSSGSLDKLWLPISILDKVARA